MFYPSALSSHAQLKGYSSTPSSFNEQDRIPLFWVSTCWNLLIRINCFKYWKYYYTIYIQTRKIILVIKLTTFRMLYILAFFRCLSYSVTCREFEKLYSSLRNRLFSFGWEDISCHFILYQSYSSFCRLSVSSTAFPYYTTYKDGTHN